MSATFTPVILKQTVQGNRKVSYGTFANSNGATGGEVLTGLSIVEFFELQHTGSSVVSDVPVANETFPLVGGSVTIVTVADTSGIWKAIGY